MVITIRRVESSHFKVGNGVDRRKDSLAFDLVIRRDLSHQKWSVRTVPLTAALIVQAFHGHGIRALPAFQVVSPGVVMILS